MVKRCGARSSEHVRPGVRLLTETNVPHVDNISYFGDGDDEANMVSPVCAAAARAALLRRGDTTAPSSWASTVGQVSESATWFNFSPATTGSGLRPTEDC